MHQLFCRIHPGLFLFDGFNLQYFLAQGFKKAFALLAGITNQLFNFQLAGMRDLYLYRIGIIVCRRSRLCFRQLL